MSDSLYDNHGYSCLDCDAKFDTVEGMNDHIDAEHNEGYGQGVAEDER